MTTATTQQDPFAAIRHQLPTTAPGDTDKPYPYPDPDRWCPVIYYYAGGVQAGEGKIWLVEPFPAARADGSDGLDPVDAAGVAVLRGTAAPRPRGDHARTWDGDWIIPGKGRRGDCAYDAYVTNQPDLLAAWCEAWAIAAALNNGVAAATGVHPEDVEVLLAAERRALTGDSRFARSSRALTWTPIGAADSGALPVGVRTRQAGRLSRRLAVIEATVVRERQPGPAAWKETEYGLTGAGAETLAIIRRQGVLVTDWPQ